MRPVAVVLIVVALVASGLAAFLAKRWMVSSSERQEASVAVAEVLVAAREVPAGSILQAGDLRWDKWPPSAINPRLVTRTAGQDPTSRFVGTVVRFALAEGEPLSESGVFKQDAAGILAAMLTPGMRAVSIAISNPSAVSGFISPGDHVDVVLGADISRAEGRRVDAGPIAQFASETILENVRVLAIDQQISRARDGAAILGKTATVEVTPKQGEILTTAGMMGQLSLVLRSVAQPPAKPEDKEAPKDPFTADTEVSKALEAVHGGAFAPAPEETKHKRQGPSVRVNRGGSISTQSF